MWEDHISHSLIDDVMGVTLHQELDGLFDNDLWEHYNVFKWDYPCIRELNDHIKECYKNFGFQDNLLFQGYYLISLSIKLMFCLFMLQQMCSPASCVHTLITRILDTFVH